jgi:hypothetical protein
LRLPTELQLVVLGHLLAVDTPISHSKHGGIFLGDNQLRDIDRTIQSRNRHLVALALAACKWIGSWHSVTLLIAVAIIYKNNIFIVWPARHLPSTNVGRLVQHPSIFLVCETPLAIHEIFNPSNSHWKYLLSPIETNEPSEEGKADATTEELTHFDPAIAAECTKWQISSQLWRLANSPWLWTFAKPKESIAGAGEMMTQTAQIFGRHKVHLKADKVVVKVELQGCRISSGTFNGRAGCGCEQKLAKLLEPLLNIGNWVGSERSGTTMEIE